MKLFRSARYSLLSSELLGNVGGDLCCGVTCEIRLECERTRDVNTTQLFKTAKSIKF